MNTTSLDNHVLTPLSRGTLWKNHGALKVLAEQNRGDFERNGRFHEYVSTREHTALTIISRDY